MGYKEPIFAPFGTPDGRLVEEQAEVEEYLRSIDPHDYDDGNGIVQEDGRVIPRWEAPIREVD